MTDLERAAQRIDGWAVMIEINGENVLTIGHNHLSGIPDIDKYRDIILRAAENLCSFIGTPSPAPRAGEAKDAVPDTLPEEPQDVKDLRTYVASMNGWYPTVDRASRTIIEHIDALRQHAARLQVKAAAWDHFVSLQTGSAQELCSQAERAERLQVELAEARAYGDWAQRQGLIWKDRAEAAERTVGELRAHIRRMGDSATDMFEQMLRGKWVDDHGHDVRMNKAMAELCEAVKLATPAARET